MAFEVEARKEAIKHRGDDLIRDYGVNKRKAKEVLSLPPLEMHRELIDKIPEEVYKSESFPSYYAPIQFLKYDPAFLNDRSFVRIGDYIPTEYDPDNTVHRDKKKYETFIVNPTISRNPEYINHKKAIIFELLKNKALMKYFMSFKQYVLPEPLKYTGKYPFFHLFSDLTEIYIELYNKFKDVEIERSVVRGELLRRTKAHSIKMSWGYVQSPVVNVIYIAPYIQRLKKELGDNLKEVEFTRKPEIRIEGALPFYLKEEENTDPKPMNILVEPTKSGGMFVSGDNGAGKSTYMELLKYSIYHAGSVGLCPAEGDVKIGWMPTDVVHLNRRSPNFEKMGTFQSLIRNTLDRIDGTDEKTLLFFDDVFEGTSATQNVIYWYKKLMELKKRLKDHDKNVYLFSTMRFGKEVADDFKEMDKMHINDKNESEYGTFISEKGESTQEMVDKELNRFASKFSR